MKILIDECVPRRFKHELTGHEVRTVPEAGWAGKTNRELLRLAAEQFDVFLTIDQNLQYQQKLSSAAIAVVIVCAKDNRLETLRRLAVATLEAIDRVTPGEVIRVEE